MAEDRIDSIVAQRAFDEVERLKQGIADAQSSLVNFNKVASGIELKLGDTKSIIQLNTLLEELGDNQKKVQQATLEQAKASAALALAEERLERAELQRERTNTQSLKTQQEQLKIEKQLAAEKERLEKASRREEKAIADLSNDYGILSKAYQEAALKAKNYALQLGANHAITIQAQNDAKAMGDRLKQLDGVVGQFQRNVGNYNMVGAQFAQILREIPNAGISLQTFVISLSNNLSYLVESFVSARKAGQSWGQILSGLFKGGNALILVVNLVIAAITIFSAKMAQASKSTKELTRELTEEEKALKAVAEQQAQETSRLSVLISVATDAANSYASRTRAVQELQKLYPQYFSNLRTEQFLTGEAANAYMELSNALFARARATALMSRFTELASKELEIQEKINDLKAQQPKTPPVIDSTGAFNYANNEDTQKAMLIRQQIQELDSQLIPIRAKQIEYQKQINSQQSIEADNWRSIKKEVKETGDEMRKAFRLPGMGGGDTTIVSTQATQLQKMMLEEAQRLRMLQESYAGNLISYEEYQKGREQIAATISRQIIQYQIDETKAILAGSQLTVAERTKYETQLTELLAKLRAKEKDDFAKNERDKRKEIEETLNLLRTYQTAFNDITKLSQINTDAQIEGLNAQYDATQRNLQNEINGINRSNIAKEEKERRIQEAEAKTFAQQEILRGQELAARQKQAEFDRQVAIMNIILNTAVAVTAAKTIAGRIAAATAGAAQLAIALSTPIPQYAVGTDNHPGGLAEIAEGNKPELVKEPGKDPYMVGKHQIRDLPKGTKVFNQQQMYGMLTPQMVSLLVSKSADKKELHELKEAVQEGTRRTVHAINKNKAQLSVIMQGSNNHYNKYVKGL